MTCTSARNPDDDDTAAAFAAAALDSILECAAGGRPCAHVVVAI